MAGDTRHLRARWTIAVGGWSLWTVSIMLPLLGSDLDDVERFYRDVVGKYVLMNLRGGSLVEAAPTAVVMGFVSASIALAASPVLVGLNHIRNVLVRRWRWLGVGLLPVTLLSITIVTRWGFTLFWPLHLFALAHILVCTAIVPWPWEQAMNRSGFGVLTPGRQQHEE